MTRLLDVLRRAGAAPALEPGVALLLRARLVRGSAAFVARELAGRRSVRAYALRETGVRVVLRHATGDVVTLGEVFHDRQYVPPAEVAARLGAGPTTVLDLGANVGLFGAFVLGRWPGARITAVEPDPANAAVLRRTVAANGAGARWSVIEAAAGTGDGELAFVAGLAALSRPAVTGVPPAPGGTLVRVPVVDVLGLVAASDLVKLDAEGAEWELLAHPRFAAAPPRVLVLEYHPHPRVDDPHAEVRARLCAAGMAVAPILARDDGHGMLWAWRV